MRKIQSVLVLLKCLFFTASCTAPAVRPDSAAVNNMLAEKNYQLGEEVERISDIQLDNRTFVDSKNLIMPTDNDGDFLVNLKHPCHGLKANPVWLRSGKHRAMEKYDRFTTRHEQTNVDHCFVDAIYKLEPK